MNLADNHQTDIVNAEGHTREFLLQWWGSSHGDSEYRAGEHPAVMEHRYGGDHSWAAFCLNHWWTEAPQRECLAPGICIGSHI